MIKILSLALLFLAGCAAVPLDKNKGTLLPVSGISSPHWKGPEPVTEENTAVNSPQRGESDWAAIPSEPITPHYATTTGSLFQSGVTKSVYHDGRPDRLGDIVTVILSERHQAQKRASSELDKSTNLSLPTPNVAGHPLELGGLSLSYDVNNSNQFSGRQDTNQSNSLQGAISVEVIEVLANGNLFVQGEKWLLLNSGEEFIRLRGHIRPQDISAENTIESTRIANAQIQYSGTGDRQDTQKLKGFNRFFNLAL